MSSVAKDKEAGSCRWMTDCVIVDSGDEQSVSLASRSYTDDGQEYDKDEETQQVMASREKKTREKRKQEANGLID